MRVTLDRNMTPLESLELLSVKHETCLLELTYEDFWTLFKSIEHTTVFDKLQKQSCGVTSSFDHRTWSESIMSIDLGPVIVTCSVKEK